MLRRSNEIQMVDSPGPGRVDVGVRMEDGLEILPFARIASHTLFNAMPKFDGYQCNARFSGVAYR